MAISLLAGFTVGLSPSASAHKNTGSVAVVQGEVVWPELPKQGDLCPDWPLCDDDPEGFDLLRGVSDLADLDVRHSTGDPLNGCRLEGGNSAPGLPVGTLGELPDPGTLPPPPVPPANEQDVIDWLTAVGEWLGEDPPELLDNTDLCFIFEGLDIQAVGIYEGRAHATSFDCLASGTTGATGDGSSATDPALPLGEGGDLGPVGELVEGALPTFGAFYGEFTCDGSALLEGAKDFVPSADGHFHGWTVGATTIAFLGTVHCTVANAGRDCPAEDVRRDADVNESRIKHTLSCKGEVVLSEDPEDWVEKDPSSLDDIVLDVLPINNALLRAGVDLVCVIA